MVIDTKEIADRTYLAFASTFRQALEDRSNLLARYCESPIEVALGIAVWMFWEIHGLPLMMHVCPQDEMETKGVKSGDRVLLVPQFKIGPWRADFLLDIIVDGKSAARMIVECDGHDYHERTPAMAERDKRRDRGILGTGIPTFRFTGREIHRDPYGCAWEVFEHLIGIWPRPEAVG